VFDHNSYAVGYTFEYSFIQFLLEHMHLWGASEIDAEYFVYVVVTARMQLLFYFDSTHPFPFGRICFVVLVMRKGGESS